MQMLTGATREAVTGEKRQLAREKEKRTPEKEKSSSRTPENSGLWIGKLMSITMINFSRSFPNSLSAGVLSQNSNSEEILPRSSSHWVGFPRIILPALIKQRISEKVTIIVIVTTGSA